jgi:hypothetical protein
VETADESVTGSVILLTGESVHAAAGRTMERLVVDGAEVLMKGAEKPKKVAKKVAQKSLKEKRADKRAAAASKPSSAS